MVVFICNHCPYVKAITERLVRDAETLKNEGVSLVTINSNDAVSYPEDSFENMARFAIERMLRPRSASRPCRPFPKLGAVPESGPSLWYPLRLRQRRHGHARRVAMRTARQDAATPHSITSSARARSTGGIVRPSARAVLRLITSSNVVGCSTGRSPGFSPLRIRST